MNLLFPGLPDYHGPKEGMFFALHHSLLCEHSDNVMERVEYVKANKPASEIPIRLANMMYLSPEACQQAYKYDALLADYEAKSAALLADYEAKCAPLWADYEAKCAALLADYEAKRDALRADCGAKRDALSADYEAKCAALSADYEAKCAPLWAATLAYVRSVMPDCAWDEQTNKLKGT